MASETKKPSTTIAYNYYLLDRQYKSSEKKVGTNLLKVITQAQDFYNGNQFPNNNSNNALRISINICSFAANIKASKICGTPIYLAYTADNTETDCTKLRQFDEYNCNKLHQKTFNFQSALNGFVNGTEIAFVRWDEDDTSYAGIYKGGLVYEHIDPRNFAVANNRLPAKDIQNQKWVMFWNYMEVGAVKEILEGTESEKKEKEEALCREVSKADELIDLGTIAHSLVRVYTRSFKLDGEVYFECSTQNVDIFKYPHPLNRKLHTTKIKKIVDEFKKNLDERDPDGNKVKDYKIDYEDLIMQHYKDTVLTEDEYKEIKEKFSLYPFAVFVPFVDNDAFWGRSDVKSLIPIQKGINYMITMTLKCAENNAYNKILVKPDTLQGQVITNEPSQVLVDYSGFTNGWGYKTLETPPVPNGLLDFSDRLLAMTRVIYGFNDVMDGSVTNKDMSGYMLQQMIKQSNTAIEQQQQIFWEFQEDLAAIRLTFYKHYVDQARYTAELSDTEYAEAEESRKMLHNRLLAGKKLKKYPMAKAEDFERPTHRSKIYTITNKEMYGVRFDIMVEAMQGLADSKLIESQMWDNLFINGGIKNIEPELLEAYFNANPNVSPRTKAAIKAEVERLKNGKIAKLEQQLQDIVQKTQQIIDYAKQLENVVGYQGNYLKNLTAEFTGKINTQNKIINGLTTDLAKFREGDVASEGEVKSNNSRGISGTGANGAVQVAQ